MRKSTYLFATLDDIKGTDGSVGKAACKDTTHHAFSVVVEVVDV